MDRRTLPNALVFLLLALSLLASLPAASSQTRVDPDQVAAVRAETGQDAAAPFGQWESVLDSTTFFLHRNATIAVQDTPAGTADIAEDYYLDYEKPQPPLRTVTAPIGTVDPETGDQNVVPDISDPNDKKVDLGTVTGGASAYFIIPLPLTQNADVRVYAVEFGVYAHCGVYSPGNAGLSVIGTALGDDEVGVPTGMSGSLDVLDFKDGAWTTRISSGSRSHAASVELFNDPLAHIPEDGVFQMSGRVEIGSPDLGNGVLVRAPAPGEPGMRLQIGVLAPLAGPTCYLHFDSANWPSFVRITSDSSRINTWIENRDGNYAEGLSAPSRTFAGEREFLTQVIHASTWPDINDYHNPRVDAASPCDSTNAGCKPAAPIVDANEDVDYLDDFWDRTDDADPDTAVTEGPGGVLAASDLNIRIRDLENFALVNGDGAAQVQQFGRTVKQLGDAVNRIQYTWFYPATLPEHPHRSEVFSNVHGTVPSQTVVFGLKGFTFDLLDTASHTVNPGEATEFRMRVRNIGAEDDTVTVVAQPPGSSWAANMVGASTHLLKANGGEAEVVLRVTPPASAVVGVSQAVTVTAASVNFPGEVLPKTQSVSVAVVSAVSHGVDLTVLKNTIVMQPGNDTVLAGIRVRNTGTTVDTYVLQPSVPATAQGWTVQAIPLSKEIPAASSTDFGLRVRAPATASGGQSFILPLTAVRLGDSTVSDRVDLTVIVQVIHDVLVVADKTPLRVRIADHCHSQVNGQPPCSGSNTVPPADEQHDKSPMFRFVITNKGSQVDTFRATAAMVGQGDNAAGWNIAIGNASTIAAAPSSSASRTMSVTLAPGESTAVYVRMTWAYVNAFGVLHGHPANTKSANFIVRSGNDQGLEKTTSFQTGLDGPTTTAPRQANGEYTGALQGVAIATNLTDPDGVATVDAGNTVDHAFRVTNQGNEIDNLIVQVPSASQGWTRQLHFLGTAPTGKSCTSSTPTRFVCQNMGVGEEAFFRLSERPAGTVPVGQIDRAAVTVISGDDGTESQTLEFVTTKVGSFQFDAQGLVASKDAVKGKSALLPFVIRNQGTNGDRYTITPDQGDSSWFPRLGIPSSVFIPAGGELSGFLSVTVPGTATQSKFFRLVVANEGNGATPTTIAQTRFQDQIDFTVNPVNAGLLRLAGDPSNVTTLPTTNTFHAVRVAVQEPTLTGTETRVVNVTVVPNSLPVGWDVQERYNKTTLTGTGTQFVEFHVRAPAGALGSSRVPFLLRAVSEPAATAGQADLLVQLADTFGVKLSPDGPTNQTVSPGAQVVYNMTIANLGTSDDTMRLTTSGAPTGWLIQADPPELALGPLENKTVKLLVRAPANAAPRALAATTVQAASLGSGAVSSISVVTRVGFYELNVTSQDSNVTRLAPTESATRVYTLRNLGTVTDEVVLTPELVNGALASQVTFKTDAPTVTLLPNQTKDVRLQITMGAAPPSDSDMQARTLFSSRLAPASAPANVTLPLNLHVIRYVDMDTDADGIKEYAVDRDGSANGYEDYLDTGVGGGKASTLADLERFLTEDARKAATKGIVLATGTTVEVIDLAIDGDKDSQRDLFIDSTSDGLPDHYWDPDGAKRQDLTTSKDVDGDAVPDYFVDTDGAIGLDRVYSLRQGKFTDLVAIDIDGDGTKDFVVDKNGNGKLDADETVLYSKSGRLLTVQKIDMDGNGEVDSVFDTDGDGVPDYFIPAGEEGSVEIVVKDVNGDGEADWAYDADGDGRLDSYYEPSSGNVGFIDAKSSFREALKDHWYIGALFGVVLVLFVVLLIVTRR